MALLQWLEEISAAPSTVLVAVGVGIVGLLVAFCLRARGSDSGSGSREKKERKSDGEEEQEGGGEADREEGAKRKKQWKAKNAPKTKRTTLPSHPLLTADFKGHTGAVLSLDFDSSGRYLVSCSEGDCLSVHRLSLCLLVSRSQTLSAAHPLICQKLSLVAESPLLSQIGLFGCGT